MEKNLIGKNLKKLRFVAAVVAAFAALCVPAGAKTFNLFLLTGQSNSLGAIKGNAADAKKMKPEPKKVVFWHGNFSVYCTGGDSTKWGRVEPQQESQIVMGPEYGFARGLEKGAAQKHKISPADCGILKVSRDGGGNTNWIAPNGEAYKRILAVARQAIAALPARGYDSVDVRALLYLQGESDNAAEAQVAGTRLANLRENLERDLAALKVSGIRKISTAKVALLIGEPANWHGKDTHAPDGTTARENLKKLSESAPRAAWIETRDLPKIKTGDAMGVHYDGNAQLVIGQRFADAYARLKD